MTPYNFFGDIICINLDTRKDRRAYAESVFKRLSIPARFYTAKKHPKGGVHGCFDSHIQIVLDAYHTGKDNVLVFEDDLLPTDSYSSTHLMNAIEFMKNNKSWDIFYLGYFVFKHDFSTPYLQAPRVTNYKHIIQFNPYTTHAMVYSKRAIQKIVRLYKNYIGKMHYDFFLSGYSNLKNYCYTPILFDQKFCLPSDIPAMDIVETVARKSQCFAEKNKLIYRISFLKDILDTYYLYIYAVLCLIGLLVLISVKSK